MDRQQDLQTTAVEALLKRLDWRDHVAQEERETIQAAAGPLKYFAAGQPIIEQHARPKSSLLMASGMAARHNILEMGEQQITAFHILGDFVDLHSLLLSKLDHGVSAVTDVVAVEFPHAKLLEITERLPHLTRMLWLSTILDGAIHRQWLVAMGRMPALGHIAHLFCEHFVRARVVGLVQNDASFPFDITQNALADALGLSGVHVNRMVQELRRRHLVRWEDGIVTILDWKTLQRVGQFDDTYLDLERQQR
ncbi:MAG TPA: Crp/Fnr family transcriptional regulator [Devosia sp.]|jgi:CRP-like cAMP-binding protein|uniref:Crp/Fnr family transcriptional regulator n=1 Tax=Devosia sp. TaxID=1871048 RepID=UPI002F94CBF0